MRNLSVLFIHFIAVLARLLGPGGVRSLIAESLLLKHQILILNRSCKRSPNLHVSDRILAGLLAVLLISPMSNGNVALMTNLVKFGALPWDLVLGTDLVKHYKPDREMYMSAPFYLDLKPEEVMMCAAHNSDLQAARKCGLRTGFIYRPNEYGGGPAGVPDRAEPGDFDVVSKSIIDLAQQMGA
jgi:beta-phosphoglucomutase-like phosphatase (HAD superfamily)